MDGGVDVLVLGGAFAGSAAAVLLRRENPSLRVEIVERAEAFDRKVGEATTEVSGAFLTKRLGLTHHLAHNHIVKHGLRFWFTKDPSDTLETAGELGPGFQVRMPTFQIDREVLDEYLLDLARREGAIVHRPAKASAIDLAGPDGRALATIEEAGRAPRVISARWIIDTTGRASKLARMLGLVRKVPEHPTNALWVRFRNVKDFDSDELRRKYPAYARRVQASRTAATNHLCGYGWWCWIIPLRGGDVSAGLVYDERLFTPPEGGRIGERVLAHLRSDPIGRELFAEAEVCEGDGRALSHLPYFSEAIAGPNWAIAGDAAGFMDPLYSAGLDYASWTVSLAVDRILAEAGGQKISIDEINSQWRQSYHGWMNALYVEKYHYLGDRRLMTAAYLMDLGLFFFGPVREIVNCTRTGFAKPPFCGPVDSFVAKVMRFYNQRLAELGRQKKASGIYGADNCGVCRFIPGFAPNGGVWRNILDGAALWLVEELRMIKTRQAPNPPPPAQKAE